MLTADWSVGQGSKLVPNDTTILSNESFYTNVYFSKDYINTSRSFHSNKPAFCILHECDMRWESVVPAGLLKLHIYNHRHQAVLCKLCSKIQFLQWLSCPEQQLQIHEEVKIKDYLHRQRIQPFCGSSRTPSSSFSEFSC